MELTIPLNKLFSTLGISPFFISSTVMSNGSFVTAITLIGKTLPKSNMTLGGIPLFSSVAPVSVSGSTLPSFKNIC